MERGTGISTHQMKEAPEGAHYIVPGSGSMAYNRNLAAHLERLDLVLVTPDRVSRLHPSEIKALIVDHAVFEHASRSDMDRIHELAEYLRERERKRGAPRPEQGKNER